MFEKIRSMAAGNFGLPGDVVLGEFMVTVLGNRHILIENYRSILFYDGQTLRIQGLGHKLEITGKALCIDSYDRDEIRVSGLICGMSYLP